MILRNPMHLYTSDTSGFCVFLYVCLRVTVVKSQGTLRALQICGRSWRSRFIAIRVDAVLFFSSLVTSHLALHTSLQLDGRPPVTPVLSFSTNICSMTLHSSHGRTGSHSSITSLTSIASAVASPSSSTCSEYIIPLFILVSIAFASATQTELAHYLTSKGNYSQAYFTFYLTHSSFVLVFPIHLAILKVAKPKIPVKVYIDSLRHVLATQLGKERIGEDGWRDVMPGFSKIILGLTVLMSAPAISWFIAMNFTTGLAVSTIYASSSFWVYLFAMWLLKQPLSRVTAGSIALAFAGVVVLSWSGLQEGSSEEDAPNPMLGDIIMMFGEWDYYLAVCCMPV